MPQYLSFRYALRLKPAQERTLRRWAGQLRWVWNRALAEQRARRARGEKYANYYEMAKWLTAWRNNPETSWLAEGPCPPQQQVLRRLHTAYQRFFESSQRARNGQVGKKFVLEPKFKRHGHDPSLLFPDLRQFHVDEPNSRIRILKLGWVRFRCSRPTVGTTKNIAIAFSAGKWVVCIETENRDVLPAAGLVPTVGIDLGVAHFATTSAGEHISHRSALEENLKRLRRYQRAFWRRKPGSSNRKKITLRIGRLHARIARQRHDWLHKASAALAQLHPVIAIEDLHVERMQASARGTIDAPGKNVRAKASLNRRIHDAAWGEFRRQLAYKLRRNGGELVAVDAKFTSQRCNLCGFTHAENRRTQDTFKCLQCGHRQNADLNAAHNILAAGHAVWASRISPGSPTACGATVSHAQEEIPVRAVAEKQEPAEDRSAVARSLGDRADAKMNR